MKTLEYLVIGYKPNQSNYVELNNILSIISYSIFKSYCISENRKKYLDILYFAKAEVLKVFEISKVMKNESKLFRDVCGAFCLRKTVKLVIFINQSI